MKPLTLICLFLSMPTYAQNSDVFHSDSLPLDGGGSAFIITLPLKNN